MTAEERLIRHYRRRQAAAALSEAALFEAHGLPMTEALERIRRQPRRRCVCGVHRARVA